MASMTLPPSEKKTLSVSSDEESTDIHTMIIFRATPNVEAVIEY